MSMFRNLHRHWNQWREAEKREEDERERLARLLAYRDAFVALVLILVVYLFAQPFLASQVQDDRAVPAILALFPVAALAVAGVVWNISWRLRSGGVETGVAAFKAVKTAAGLAVGYVVIALISWSGITPMRIEPSSFLWASIIGIAVATAVVLFFNSRTGPPGD
ncbi:MAG: hypothetical protein WD333_05885 [Dehalococcoidia bacterium]